MRYHAVAADYDGTLAHHGRLADETLEGLRRLRDSGRKLVMVTGRELDELLGIVEHPELFDRIVAENGAVLYQPEGKRVRALAEAPPPAFIDALRARGVQRIGIGRVIVATWEPYEDVVFHVIKEQGLELHVIFNKGAVMVLPSGVNKATGLTAALCELGLSPHNVVAVGDAENDHAMMAMCECSFAVANALPSVGQRADFVTARDHGGGVVELIDQLVEHDLAAVAPKLGRHHVVLGRVGGADVAIDPYSANLMVCGTSGGGKSTLTTSLLEQLGARGYQYVIADPEGDFNGIKDAIVLGGIDRAPSVTEILDVLRDPTDNVVVNMLGVALEHRPEFFVKLAAALTELRMTTGRPHWLVVDEAHHLLPASRRPSDEATPMPSNGVIYITVHPDAVSPQVARGIRGVLVVGANPDESVRELAAIGKHAPPAPTGIEKLAPGQALYWPVGGEPRVIQTAKPETERTRHSRKYIEGNIGPDRAFYFRGREGKLKLKAHNLMMFLQIADGVDDDTWTFHLDNRDYSRWLRGEIKDGDLADEVAAIETDHTMPPTDKRAAIREAIERRYTLPADAPSGVIDKPEASTAA